jgi:hypothetical protein
MRGYPPEPLIDIRGRQQNRTIGGRKVRDLSVQGQRPLNKPLKYDGTPSRRADSHRAIVNKPVSQTFQVSKSRDSESSRRHGSNGDRRTHWASDNHRCLILNPIDGYTSLSRLGHTQRGHCHRPEGYRDAVAYDDPAVSPIYASRRTTPLEIHVRY